MPPDPEQNGQRVPIVGGFPVLSQAVPWAWECHQIARDDATGEKIFLLRLKLQTGPFELWAPASFLRDMGEKLAAICAGISIAQPGDIPPAP